MKTKMLCAATLLAASLFEEVPVALAAPAPAAEVQPVVYRQRRRVVVKRRSKRKSAAIVGGSALGGAAIGALAGGGKGAAIGAIAGGGAGYVYDRKTHKKVRRY